MSMTKSDLEKKYNSTLNELNKLRRQIDSEEESAAKREAVGVISKQKLFKARIVNEVTVYISALSPSEAKDDIVSGDYDVWGAMEPGTVEVTEVSHQKVGDNERVLLSTSVADAADNLRLKLYYDSNKFSKFKSEINKVLGKR